MIAKQFLSQKLLFKSLQGVMRSVVRGSQFENHNSGSLLGGGGTHPTSCISRLPFRD